MAHVLENTHNLAISRNLIPRLSHLPALLERKRRSRASLTIENVRDGSSLIGQFVALGFVEFKASGCHCHNPWCFTAEPWVCNFESVCSFYPRGWLRNTQGLAPAQPFYIFGDDLSDIVVVPIKSQFQHGQAVSQKIISDLKSLWLDNTPFSIQRDYIIIIFSSVKLNKRASLL